MNENTQALLLEILLSTLKNSQRSQHIDETSCAYKVGKLKLLLGEHI